VKITTPKRRTSSEVGALDVNGEGGGMSGTCVPFSMHAGVIEIRRRLSAANYRMVMRRRWKEWDLVSEATAFAVAA
jgi:hypothetical protein